ncbi:hypothetical protein KP001_14400 [Geomonas subterranea]|uniref:Uncharacterized protein n=1 Tax=Geomonas subterranea TaxID=2847989 RepID=A0ABX8LG14_9BACT|nr:hypothetical protein [Geomonas subterranea]QXE89624.1 hypothetical protein KP001_14400 [Geomonas subterranea]QXM08260.1 hypothetical protein KP002_14880 [Geomonas subterranea]
MNNASFELFVRLVRQKHQQLVSNLNTVLEKLSGEDAQSKTASAEAMSLTAKDLRGLMANEDIPNWLNQTIQSLTNYTSGQWNGYNLLVSLINLKSQIESYAFVFENQKEVGFDFDAIYEHFKNESRLPELFEEIIRILEEIQSSGAVDSVTMLSALEKVIATIRRGKGGSYLSMISSWNFLMSFLKNYMWGELSKLPVIGTAMEALEKTIKEADEEMERLHQKVEADARRVVETEVKALAGKAQFPGITYRSTGGLITHQPDATITTTSTIA